jgi:hypothetical protein
VLNATFPPRTERYTTPHMVSVEKSTSIIYYHAYSSRIPGVDAAIWKYDFSENTWEQIGQLLFKINDFQVLPINGLSCSCLKRLT